MHRLPETFKALGDPLRLRLFYLLSCHDELCVCHLTEALSLPQSTVSRHLGVLRHAGLVGTRRDGKWMHYRLADGPGRHLADLIRQEMGEELKDDLELLNRALLQCA